MSTPTSPRSPPKGMSPTAKGCLIAVVVTIALFVGSVVVLGIIGAMVGHSSSNAPVAPATNAPATESATPVAMPPERPISWREIDSIYNLRSNNTDLQKDEAWKRYKGKRVTWYGTVTSVADGWTGLTLQVKMNPETFTSDLLIKLKKSEKAKAAQLHQREQVRFTGILSDWGSLMPITLNDGEIIE